MTHPDAEALRQAIIAIREGIGRGGLSYIAERLGMSPSAMRKRLESPTAGFDEPTMRAVLFIAEMKAENHSGSPVIESNQVGPYIIEIRQAADEQIVTWRLDQKHLKAQAKAGI